jgi:multisubunit Na+/H+ antiporter MnhG subunit
MANQDGPVIDMTPDGDFILPPKPTLGTILARLAMFGILLCIGAVAFWAALILLPVLLIGGVAGFLLLRAQLRRNGVVMFRRSF